MLKKILIAILALGLFSATAEAKSLHHRHHFHHGQHHIHHGHHHKKIAHSFYTGYGFVRGHNICAINVNRILHWMGRKTTGSPSAASFHMFSHTASPVSGDVLMVKRKGGSGWHVAVYQGGGICRNPSSQHQGWTYPKCTDIWRGHYRFFVHVPKSA